MGDKPNYGETTNERLFRILDMDLGTYIIETYTVNHPTAGILTKERIVYYNRRDEIETIEFYYGYIRDGYSSRS